jgi:hypothetical protein
MIINKTRYNPITLLNPYKMVMAFCLMTFLFAKPIPPGLTEIKYEFLDAQERENSSEQEIVSEYEDEIAHLNNYDMTPNLLSMKQLAIRNPKHLSLSNFNPEVVLPPPRN